jgi:hypothetical protein
MRYRFMIVFYIISELKCSGGRFENLTKDIDLRIGRRFENLTKDIDLRIGCRLENLKIEHIYNKQNSNPKQIYLNIYRLFEKIEQHEPF